MKTQTRPAVAPEPVEVAVEIRDRRLTLAAPLPVPSDHEIAQLKNLFAIGCSMIESCQNLPPVARFAASVREQVAVESRIAEVEADQQKTKATVESGSMLAHEPLAAVQTKLRELYAIREQAAALRDRLRPDAISAVKARIAEVVAEHHTTLAAASKKATAEADQAVRRLPGILARLPELAQAVESLRFASEAQAAAMDPAGMKATVARHVLGELGLPNT